MNQIKWKLSNCHGYGDVVAAISYAVNQHTISKQQIKLEFCFTDSQQLKCKHTDTETLQQRCQYLFNCFNCPGVDLSFSYQYNGRQSEGYAGPQGNQPRWPTPAVDPLNKYLNLAFASYQQQYKPLERIVVGSSRHNKEPFGKNPNWKKSWKDPLEGRYRHLLEKIEQYHVDEIYYYTPIEQACDLINQCDLFIGYHGSSSWIARMLGKPMIIFSKTEKYTLWDFPWCEHLNGLGQLVDIERKHERSFKNISLCVEQHEKYIKKHLFTNSRI